ncbi:unnamed protein product [Oncorhynchus mykiss]|uniref:Cadherin domain-containing protein n=1 Tax=Oncorhynchus mykiss TaxID=8022 RepID=A0A060XHT5_ONCMY|nr:unnamed protein product [Oncorhynchus mykiss]
MPRSAKAGHLVTKVTAVDADSGHNAWISYKLVEATDASLFNVNLYTGEVRTKRAVSEQDDSSQRLLIEIQDDGVPVQSSTVTLTILVEDGLHEPILDLRQKTPEPSKKSGRITLYLILSLASVSVLSLVTFVILANPNRNLQIQLNTDGPIKYVEVLGGDMLSQSQSFRSCLSPMSEFSDFTFIKPSSTTDFKEMINVLDASLPDSAWTFESQQTRYTIPEELKQGSVVGNLAKDLGLGLSEIFDRKLHVAAEAGKQYFNVDAGKGELVVNERIDRETLCGQSASCVLPLQVVIENPLQLHRIEVEIRDINDNSPNFLTKDRVLKMAELTAVGARFPLKSAEDPDVGSNSLKSYILSKDECFSVKVKDIEGGRKIPELVLEKPLDREKKAVHELLLTALDGGTPARSGTSQITVTVLDNNDNNPVFQKAVYNVRVNENSEKGTSLIKLEATDSDEGVNGEIEYSFGEHTLESVLSVFDIDAVTGEMFLKGELDYESAAYYRIDITAVDKGIPEMEGHCRVQVEVTDVNDNAPEIVLTSKPSPVREDAPSGTVVALISARDLDSGNNGKVTLQLTKGHPFSLKPSFSDNYALVTNGVLDRESFSEYNIEITATDSGSPPLTTKKTIPVSIIDVNDNPPKFSQSSYNVYLKENGPPGSMLSSVSTSDLDFGDNAKISYSILDSKVQDMSVSSYVYINSDNGSIYSMHSYDYEKLKVFQIHVQAKDHGSPSLSSNVTVHVFILDQNDNAPAVIYPSAALGSLSHQNMPRSAKAGHLVTKVTAVDADSGHNAWISYKLVEATDTSLFSVNLYTGEVRTKRAVSEQDDSSQRLLIEIHDDGEPVQSTTVTLAILVEDGLHEPILDLRQKAPEASKKNPRITLYLILSLASVSVLSMVTFIIVAYVEVLGGDMLSQSQSFRSCLSPMSEFSDFTFVKPSSTTDFKEMINVLDASLPDSAWTFESQQVRSDVDGQTRYTISEELKQGSVVGNLAKDLGLGLSDFFDRKLRVASEAGKQYFNVNAGKGELIVNERIDRETLCGQSASCVLPLQVVIENPLQLHRIEVEIRDINDNSPSFLTKELTVKIVELTVAGARFPLESAEDPDVGSNSLKSYTISKDECFTLKVKELGNGKKIPELVLEKPLDREKKSVHKLLLTALDGGNPVRSGTAEITITVLDVNDNFPVFEKSVYKVSIHENSAKGTFMIQLKATDIDEGQNGEINYSFGERTPESVLSTFNMDPDTGDIFLKGDLDFERATTYDIDITARDEGTPEMEGHCRVQVEVIDVNDNSPEIVLTSQPNPVRENAPSGTVVALISARDLDSGNNGKVTLQLPRGYPFSLKPSYSNNYALVTSDVLDRESFSEYNIEITATDSGSPPLTTKKTIPVTIIDVNDNPPKFSQPFYNVYLKENGLPGSMLSSVSASDLDFGDNAKISYSILDSKAQDVSVSSYVYMNTDNGSIYSMHSFDYEKLKVFQILVQAKDHGSPSLSSNVTVHVFILDQNDNAPAVIYPSAALGSLSHQKMPRFAKAGHLVTKVTAVDADSGHNAWVSYKLAEATDTSLFSVNLYTGEVRTKRAVSEQDDSSQRLLIEIQDDGEPVQSATVTLTIQVEDGLHELISDLRQKAPEPSKKSGRITLYLILSLASVSVLSLVTFVILAVKCVRNSRSSGSCCMRRDDLDGYKNPNRNLQIQLNTDGPIKYVEVLGGDMLSQSQSFRSCLSPMSEFSDFTFVKPSSTTDFKEMINVLDASLPDSAWNFESQQVSASILSGCITALYGNCNRRVLRGWCGLHNASQGENYLPSKTPTAPDVTGRPKRSSRTTTTRATACSPRYHPEVERLLPTYRLEIIGHSNKWISSHFINATLIMFAYLALLIPFVYTVFHSIYCILPMLLGHCSSIYLYIHILIQSLYLDLCVLGSCCGIVRLLARGLVYKNVLRCILELRMTKRMGYRDWRWLALWWHYFFLLWSTIDGQTRYTISEELKQGSVVGNLAKDLGLGLSEFFDRKLRVASEAGKQYFSVDAGKGELVVNERIDRETLCGQSASCVLPLQVVIENPLQLYRVEVEIQDINDNSPSFPSKQHPLEIAETTAAGVRFPLESAQDPDVGSNSLKSYILSKDECFTLKVKELSGGRKVPELVLTKALDREKKTVHHLLLTVVDGGNPVRSGTSQITITVLDVNDNVPVFENAVYKVSVSEKSAEGTFISAANYEIDISAKDKGSPRMEGHCSVQVDVADVNDNSPEIILTSKPSPLREDAPSGTVVALIGARDLDSGNNGKVTLQLPRGYPFSLKPSFSNNYALVTSGVLDRESFSEYNIEITATDSGSPPLTTKKTITVTIIDVNDNPPKFSQSSYNVYLKENGLPGSMLSSVSASDLDLGDNAKISYSILDSKAQDVSVSSYVYMNTDNGSIYSMHSFDYEKLKVFQILVQAKDHGSPSLSSNVTVHVFILDQNDNAPAVIYPSAALGSLSHQKMPRFAKAGYLVTAVDADSGHNAWISYKLAEATDASLFSVNLYTGEVRTKRAVSEQDDSSQRLLIEMQDDGEPVQSSTVTLAILVEDGLHEPILDLRQKAPEPSKKSGRITLYLILSLASVSVLSLVTFVILANPNRNLQIQLNTDGPIKYVEVLGGDMLSQSQSFRSCLSPMSEFSDFTFVKPSSTTDFKEMINVLDASLPDNAWTFESQQVRSEL